MKKLQIIFHKLQKVTTQMKNGLIICLLFLPVGMQAQENIYENEDPFRSEFEEYSSTWFSGRLPDDGGTENPDGSETDFPIGSAPVFMLLLSIGYQCGKLILRYSINKNR